MLPLPIKIQNILQNQAIQEIKCRETCIRTRPHQLISKQSDELKVYISGHDQPTPSGDCLSHTLSQLLATYSTPGPALLEAFWRSSFLLLSNCSFIMASRCCSGFIV